LDRKTDTRRQTRLLIWAVVTLLLLATYSASSASGTVYYALTLQNYAPISSPLVTLQNGTENLSTIYTNNTSARIEVDATPTLQNHSYALNITNTVETGWEVKLSLYDNDSIARISNATIEFHNGTDTPSAQIRIEDGNIVKSEGEFYGLPPSGTIFLRIGDLKGTSGGPSHLYVNLKIKNPGTSTYSLYIITLEFT